MKKYISTLCLILFVTVLTISANSTPTGEEASQAVLPAQSEAQETEVKLNIGISECLGQALSEEEKELLRVFIYASSMEERINRIMNVDQVSQKDAPGLIAQKDRSRRDYYYFHTGQEWGKKENYDICLNTTTFGYEGCAEILAALAKER